MLQNVDKQAQVLPATQKSPTDATKLYMQRRKEIACINGSLPPVHMPSFIKVPRIVLINICFATL